MTAQDRTGYAAIAAALAEENPVAVAGYTQSPALAHFYAKRIDKTPRTHPCFEEAARHYLEGDPLPDEATEELEWQIECLARALQAAADAHLAPRRS